LVWADPQSFEPRSGAAFTSFQKRKLKKVTGKFQEVVRLLAMAGRDSPRTHWKWVSQAHCDVADGVRRRNGQRGSKHPLPHERLHNAHRLFGQVLRLGCNGH
jgi:hypothetical protein